MSVLNSVQIKKTVHTEIFAMEYFFLTQNLIKLKIKAHNIKDCTVNTGLEFYHHYEYVWMRWRLYKWNIKLSIKESITQIMIIRHLIIKS